MRVRHVCVDISKSVDRVLPFIMLNFGWTQLSFELKRITQKDLVHILCLMTLFYTYSFHVTNVKQCKGIMLPLLHFSPEIWNSYIVELRDP